jgi:hypothetical protein
MPLPRCAQFPCRYLLLLLLLRGRLTLPLTHSTRTIAGTVKPTQYQIIYRTKGDQHGEHSVPVLHVVDHSTTVCIAFVLVLVLAQD